MSNITDSPTFCPHAWLSATHTNGGYYKPCCRFTRMTDDNDWSQGQSDNIAKLNHIRSDMIQGRASAECLNCWREERDDVPSLRTLTLKADWWRPYEQQINQTPKDGSTDIKPVYYDLKLGNTCNLGCVMCHAGDSSVIEQEHRDHITDITDKQREELEWLDQNKLSDQDINRVFDRLKTQDLVSVKFTGGEPFLNPRINDFLDECIAKGINQNISLMFTTNLIALSQKTINRLKNFPKANVSVSMEGVDRIYEYMRYPTTWSKFESNWKKLQKTEISHDVVFTVSALNVSYMGWWLAWLEEQKVNWMPNIVWDPVHLSLPEMPEELKSQSINNLKACQEQWPNLETILQNIINICAQPSATNHQAWLKTVKQIEFQDRIRGRSVEDFLPGFLSHIS